MVEIRRPPTTAPTTSATTAAAHRWGGPSAPAPASRASCRASRPATRAAGIRWYGSNAATRRPDARCPARTAVAAPRRARRTAAIRLASPAWLAGVWIWTGCVCGACVSGCRAWIKSDCRAARGRLQTGGRCQARASCARQATRPSASCFRLYSRHPWRSPFAAAQLRAACGVRPRSRRAQSRHRLARAQPTAQPKRGARGYALATVSKGPAMSLIQQLTRHKPVEQLQAEAGGSRDFRRVLGVWQLTAIGIGAIIGVGIFVLAGQQAAINAGPAVILSFIVAGIGSACAALAYAEFSGMIPVTGSAYTYGYAVLGELLAWIIGWDLLLEYALIVAVVAIGWSGYVQALVAQLTGAHLPLWLQGAYDPANPHSGKVFNVIAAGISLLIAWMLTVKTEWGARANTIIVAIKVIGVALVIVAGAFYVNPANWHPFIPPAVTGSGATHFGWGGVLAASSIVFFACFGYDTLTTAAEEARNPQRDLPRAVLLSLALSMVLYLAVSLVLKIGRAHV